MAKPIRNRGKETTDILSLYTCLCHVAIPSGFASGPRGALGAFRKGPQPAQILPRRKQRTLCEVSTPSKTQHFGIHTFGRPASTARPSKLIS
jgi:hypothetical protein